MEAQPITCLNHPGTTYEFTAGGKGICSRWVCPTGRETGSSRQGRDEKYPGSTFEGPGAVETLERTVALKAAPLSYEGAFGISDMLREERKERIHIVKRIGAITHDIWICGAENLS